MLFFPRLSLRPTTDLGGNCFGFPSEQFTTNNSIRGKFSHDPFLLVTKGDEAIDFSLHTVAGPLETDVVTLSELLVTKPVVLLYGMYSCPAFQGYYSDNLTETSFSKWDEYALVERFQDDVHFIHLSTIEPHPLAPDTNFDTGAVSEYAWSDSLNPRTWAERELQAARIAQDLHPQAILALDNLDGAPSITGMALASQTNNPVFCSYGLGARIGFLISQDGTIFETEGWFHATTMAEAIEEALLEAQIASLKASKDAWGEHRAITQESTDAAIGRSLDTYGDANDANSPHAKDAKDADAGAEPMTPATTTGAAATPAAATGSEQPVASVASGASQRTQQVLEPVNVNQMDRVAQAVAALDAHLSVMPPIEADTLERVLQRHQQDDSMAARFAASDAEGASGLSKTVTSAGSSVIVLSALFGAAAAVLIQAAFSRFRPANKQDGYQRLL